ncbi:MAG: hypothetical protein DRR19_29625 [Candidatus Parabeggiatoa sp. nov. 1]|nr:MAG: hypothetical protein DRR19_29625 [Gammaproteobacteria bacterium]
MPSRIHSVTQAWITGLLSNDERFTPFVELSLDASQMDLSQFGLKSYQTFVFILTASALMMMMMI